MFFINPLMIKKPVGNFLENEEEDVRAIRHSFDDIGFADDGDIETDHEGQPLGIITRGLDGLIKRFQQENDLREDGHIFPGGETERSLVAQQQKKNRPKHGEGILIYAPEAEDNAGVWHSSHHFDPLKPHIKNINGVNVNQDKVAEGIGKILEERAEISVPVPDHKPETNEPKLVELDRTEKLKESSVDIRNLTKDESDALNAAYRHLADFKKKKHILAAEYLDHYLSGKGGEVSMPQEEFDRNKVYRKSIEINNKRLEESIVKGVVDKKIEWHGNAARVDKGVDSPFQDMVLNLKEGESMTLQNPRVREAGDRWDRDISRIESLSDPDHALAVGAVKLKSLNNLTATRQGDVIEIKGEVRHIIDDIYDFNDDTFIDRNAFINQRLLSESGLAKPFKIYGEKKQKINAILKVKNGKITDYKFDWNDKKE